MRLGKNSRPAKYTVEYAELISVIFIVRLVGVLNGAKFFPTPVNLTSQKMYPLAGPNNSPLQTMPRFADGVYVTSIFERAKWINSRERDK